MSKIRYNRLQMVLFEFDVDQKELADVLDVTANTVSRWCRNESQPQWSQFHEIAKFFRIDVRRLIEPTDWSNEAGISPVEAYKIEKEKKQKASAAKSKPKRKRRY